MSQPVASSWRHPEEENTSNHSDAVQRHPDGCVFFQLVGLVWFGLVWLVSSPKGTPVGPTWEHDRFEFSL